MTNQEKNEEVARKLGWLKHNRTCEAQTPGASIFTYGNHWYQRGFLCRERMPDYIGSIAAAWEIVDKIREKEGRIRIEDNEKSDYKQDRSVGIWHVDIWTNRGSVCVNANSAPEAIVEAFLKLKE